MTVLKLVVNKVCTFIVVEKYNYLVKETIYFTIIKKY